MEQTLENIIQFLRTTISEQPPFAFSSYNNDDFLLQEVNPFRICDFTKNYILLKNSVSTNTFFVGISTNVNINKSTNDRIEIKGITLENNDFSTVFTKEEDIINYDDTKIYEIVDYETYIKDNWIPVVDLDLREALFVNVPVIPHLYTEVTPADYSSVDIPVWEVEESDIVKTFPDGIFMVTGRGNINLVIRIRNGISMGTDFVKELNFEVIPVEDYNEENWVPVEDIINVPIRQQINVPFLTARNGEVQPENASDLVITWEIDTAYPNDTRAQIIDNNIFMAEIAGTAHVLLTVENGAAFGVAYTREFEIQIYE